VRIHEDIWLKLARDKAVEMERAVRAHREARPPQPTLRRRAALALLFIAARISPEVREASLRCARTLSGSPVHRPC